MRKLNIFIKNLFVLVSLGTCIFVFSCTSDTDNKKVSGADTLKNEKKQKQEIYKIPSPIELYQFMKDENVRFNANLLSNADNASKYVTVRARALNFGIFASDLAYCTVFNRSQETFLYFKASKTLADGMGLAEGFDDIVSKRLNNNMNNTDSLFQISNDAYDDACNYLENDDKTDILAYILMGSWIESMHLVMNSVTKFNAEDPVVTRIAEQQLILENLNSSLESIEKKDADFMDMKKKLKNVQDLFDKLYENTDVLITKKQYDDIKKIIGDLRKEIIG